MLQKLDETKHKTHELNQKIININVRNEVMADAKLQKKKRKAEEEWHKDAFNKEKQLLIEFEELECQKKREKDNLKDRAALRYGQKIKPDYYQ